MPSLTAGSPDDKARTAAPALIGSERHEDLATKADTRHFGANQAWTLELCSPSLSNGTRDDYRDDHGIRSYGQAVLKRR